MSQIVVMNPEEVAGLVQAAVQAALGQKLMAPQVVELEMLRRKDYLTTEEVAKLYPLNVNTMRKDRINGKGPAFVKLGEKVVYAQDAIRKYLESRRQKTHDQQ